MRWFKTFFIASLIGLAPAIGYYGTDYALSTAFSPRHDFTVHVTGGGGGGSGGATGNCPTGDNHDGCVIFAGSTNTLVDRVGGNVWSFNNAKLVDNTYTGVLKNGAELLFSEESWGGSGDAIILGTGGKAYIRAWSQLHFDTTQISSNNAPGLQIVAPPNQTTTPDAAWLTVAGGASATAMNIPAPSNTLYSQSVLTITADELPDNGRIVLSDGVTRVAVGQTLTQGQLTTLKFVANAGRKDTQHSSFSYRVMDPANQGNIGYVGITVNPVGLWADPVIVPQSTAGVDYAPAVTSNNIAQPAVSDDRVGFRVKNESGSTFASGKTFMHGHIFMGGTVQPTDTLCLKPTGSGACTVYLQMDVKNTWQDGTVKHSVLSFNLDTSVSNLATRDYMIAKCSGGGCPSAPAQQAASNITLAGGPEFASGTLTYTSNPNSGSENFSCKNILAASNSGTGGSASVQPRTTTTWLNGPVVKSYSAMGLVNSGRLKLQCDVYAFSDGAVVTDVVLDNSWFTQGGKLDSVLNFSTTQDGFSQTGVQSFRYGVYLHTIAAAGHPQRIGGQYIQYDVPYLIATNTVPRMEISLGVVQTAYSGALFCGGAGGNDGLLQTGCWTPHNGVQSGPLTTGLGNPGPRPDIGPEPGWATSWLAAQTDLWFRSMMGMAYQSGNIGWNFTDESTGLPINGDVHTFFSGELANGDPCDFGIGNCGGSASPYGGFFSSNDNGIAHHPGLTYMPYLITGNHSLMQLHAWLANYAGALNAFHTYAAANSSISGQSNGAIAQFFTFDLCNVRPCGDNVQIRRQAWMARTMGDGANGLPDSHPTKAFLTSQIQKGMSGLVTDKVANNMDRGFGQLRGIPTDIFAPYSLVNSGFQNSYWLYAQGHVAGYQIPRASPAARRYLQYTSNYVLGLAVHGQEGFPQFAAGAHDFSSGCARGSAPCGPSNPMWTVDQRDAVCCGNAITPATSYAALYGPNSLSGTELRGTGPGLFTWNKFMFDGNCAASPASLGGTNGSECILLTISAGQGVAWAGSPDIGALAMQAYVAGLENQYYALVVPQTSGGGNRGPGAQAEDIQQVNWVTLDMRVPTGEVVYYTNMNLSPFSNSVAQVCTTSPCVLAKLAETGSTYTQSSTNSGSADIFFVHAAGGSEPAMSCGQSCQQGGDGGGTGTMTASPNGADTYMYGGCGSGTFIGGAGNDTIALRANCFGPTAPKHPMTVQFNFNGIANKAKQIGYGTDYAGTVGKFIPGTDVFRLHASGTFTIGQFINTCNTTESPGDTTCHPLNSDNTTNTVIFKSITNPSSLTASVILF